MSITKMRQSFGSGKVLKWIVGIIAAIFVIGIFWSFGAPPSASDREGGREKGSIVATVNGEPISVQEYQNTVEQAERQQRMFSQGSMSVTQRSYMEYQALSQLIDRRLKLQAAKKEGLEVSGKEIDAEIDKAVKQQVESLKTYVIGDKKDKKGKSIKITDEELDRELRKLNSDQIPKSIGALRKSLNTREIRAAVENDLLIQKLDKEVQKKAGKVTDADLVNSYKRVRARHILVRTGGGQTDAQAKRRAEELLKKVNSGEDFAKLAKEHSEDSGSKDNGGDLGYFGQGQMVPEFDTAAFSLKPGQTSKLVKTKFGYHIIRVEDSKLELPKDFEKNKKQYREQLVAQKGQRAQWEYYEKLRDSAKIEVKEPFLKGMEYMDQASREQEKMMAKKTLAMKQFEAAVKENPNDPRAYVMLSTLYIETNQKDKAQKMLEDILDVKSLTEDADLRLHLGRLYMEKKQNDKAIKQFEIASDYSYDNLGVHYQLQGIYKELNRPDLASKEEKYIKDYSERMQREQARRMAPPADEKKPEKPKSGG